jgi:hypothetical protein
MRLSGATIASIRAECWYTVPEVAGICGCTRATVFAWLRKPGCPLETKPKPLGLYGRLISGRSLLAEFGQFAIVSAERGDYETDPERKKRAERARKELK